MITYNTFGWKNVLLSRFYTHLQLFIVHFIICVYDIDDSYIIMYVYTLTCNFYVHALWMHVQKKIDQIIISKKCKIKL